MEAIPGGIVPIVNLPGTASLLRRSYAIFKTLFKGLSQITAVILIGLLVNISLTSFIAFLYQTAPVFGKVFLQILSFAIYIGMGVFYAYAFGALVHFIAAWHRQGEVISTTEAYERSSKVYQSLFLVGLQYGFVILGSAFLIVLVLALSAGRFPLDIPSFRGLLTMYAVVLQWGSAAAIILPLLFSVWYYFCLYAVILDGARGAEALAKSRYLMHGMFFKVSGRYLVAAGLSFLVFLLIFFTLALPFGWFIFTLLGLIVGFCGLPFFVIYEYLRYEDLMNVERTTEFTYIHGERKSLLTWIGIGVAVTAFNIFLGFYMLIPELSRKNFEVSLINGTLRVLSPGLIEMNKNSIVISKFLSKFSFPTTLPESNTQPFIERAPQGGITPFEGSNSLNSESTNTDGSATY